MVIDTSKLTSGSWKTTTFGYLVILAGLVAANSGDFVKYPAIVTAAKYVTLFAIAAGFKVAKDSNVTGGTTPNTVNDPAVVKTTAVVKEP